MLAQTDLVYSLDMNDHAGDRERQEPTMTHHSPAYVAACYAALFAQALGLPPGNLWEPPIARQIEADINRTRSPQIVFVTWQTRLGLTDQ